MCLLLILYLLNYCDTVYVCARCIMCTCSAVCLLIHVYVCFACAHHSVVYAYARKRRQRVEGVICCACVLVPDLCVIGLRFCASGAHSCCAFPLSLYQASKNAPTDESKGPASKAKSPAKGSTKESKESRESVQAPPALVIPTGAAGNRPPDSPESP